MLHLLAATAATGNPTLLGIDVMFVATLLSAAAGVAILLAIYAAVTVKDPMAKRVKALNARRDQLKSGIVVGSTKKRAKLVRQSNGIDFLRDTLNSIKVLQDDQVKTVQQKLAQAGIRRKELAVFVILGRIILPIVFGGGMGIYIYLLDGFKDWGDLYRFGFFAAALIGGYKGPDIFLQNKITNRTDLIRKGLPDAIDLLVICAEAGLTIDAAFGRVSKELGSAYPELADEFSLTSIELGFLTERRQAFENLAYRVDLEHLKGVVTTMIQTEKYGTPLASALRVLSAEFRNDRMMRAEEKAARLPAIMTIPLILFILPVLFIAILGPAACSISDALVQ